MVSSASLLPKFGSKSGREIEVLNKENHDKSLKTELQCMYHRTPLIGGQNIVITKPENTIEKKESCLKAIYFLLVEMKTQELHAHEEGKFKFGSYSRFQRQLF